MKKHIKSIIAVFAVLSVVLTGIYATQRVRPYLSANSGGYLKFGGTAADTLIMNDTLTFPFYIEHTSILKPYFHILYTKVSSGNPTVKIAFSESLDGVTYFPVNHLGGSVQYAKVVSPTATTNYNINFERDTAAISGRWVRVSFITTNTPSTGVKAKISGQIKFNE